MKKNLCLLIIALISYSSFAQYIKVDGSCGFTSTIGTYKPLVCNYNIEFHQDNTGTWYISPEFSTTGNLSGMFDPNASNPINGPSNVGYAISKLAGDLARIKSLGFTEIRLSGVDYKIGVNGDINPANGNGYLTGSATTYFNLVDNFLTQVDAAGLKVIYVLGGLAGDNDFVNNNAYKAYIKDVATHYASNTLPSRTIMAYDLNNEPANYLQANKNNDKYNFTKLYTEWANCIKTVDANHLITIGFYSMADIGVNDPTLLPIDFVSFHFYFGSDPLTYNLTYVNNLMKIYYYWAGKVMTMPWIIGETSYSASNTPYDGTSLGTEVDQKTYADNSLRLSVDCNCKGFSWWKYQNTSWNIPYEDYMGIYNRWSGTTDGPAKPVATSFPTYAGMQKIAGNCPEPPNYRTFLNGSSSVLLTGYVKDNFGNIMKNVLVSSLDNAWNNSNSRTTTFTDANGYFEIKTNGLPLGNFSLIYPGYALSTPTWPWTNGATYTLTKVNYNSWVKEWSNSDVTGTLNNDLTSNWNLSIYDKFYKGDFNNDGKEDVLCVQYSNSTTTTDRMTILTYTNSFNTVAWSGGRPVSNISSGWSLLWDNQSNSANGGGIYPYRNNLVVGDFDGNGFDDVLGIGSTIWTTWFTFTPNSNPTLATWVFQDSNYGTVNNSAHPMSYMTPYNYGVVAGNFYQTTKDAIIGSMPTGNWITSFQLVGGTWTWYQSNQGQTNNPGVGYEMSYLTPYIGNFKTGDFNGDGITDILGRINGSSAATTTDTYIRPEWNPVNSNYKWNIKWTSTNSILYPYNNFAIGNFDSDNSDEIYAYNGLGVAAHVNFSTSFIPSLDGPTVTRISDWNMNLLTAYTKYLFIKTDVNSPQQQLLAIRKPDASLYAFRPNIETVTPCSTLRLAGPHKQDELSTDLANDKISFYPNPNDGNFTIQLNSEFNNANFSIKIFNVEGAVIEDFSYKNVANNLINVKLNSVKAGLYILKIINNNETFTKKVVIF